METAIIAGLVAGVISLIGFLVNIHISRKTIEANRLQLSYISAVKIVENSIKSIVDFNKETELLRIECWTMLGKLQVYSHPANLTETDPTLILNSLDDFENQQTIFSKKWSEIKGDIPDDIITVLREKRHKSRHNFTRLSYSISEFVQLLKKIGKNKNIQEIKEIIEVCEKIMGDIRRLLKDLDELYSIINTIKNNKIERLLDEKLLTIAFTKDHKSRVALETTTSS